MSDDTNSMFFNERPSRNTSLFLQHSLWYLSSMQCSLVRTISNMGLDFAFF